MNPESKKGLDDSRNHFKEASADDNLGSIPDRLQSAVGYCEEVIDTARRCVHYTKEKSLGSDAYEGVMDLFQKKKDELAGLKEKVLFLQGKGAYRPNEELDEVAHSFGEAVPVLDDVASQMHLDNHSWIWAKLRARMGYLANSWPKLPSWSEVLVMEGFTPVDMEDGIGDRLI